MSFIVERKLRQQQLGGLSPDEPSPWIRPWLNNVCIYVAQEEHMIRTIGDQVCLMKIKDYIAALSDINVNLVNSRNFQNIKK